MKKQTVTGTFGTSGVSPPTFKPADDVIQLGPKTGGIANIAEAIANIPALAAETASKAQPKSKEQKARAAKAKPAKAPAKPKAASKSKPAPKAKAKPKAAPKSKAKPKATKPQPKKQSKAPAKKAASKPQKRKSGGYEICALTKKRRAEGYTIQKDREEGKHGMKRPSKGGACALLWAAYDKMGAKASIALARETMLPKGFHPTTITRQYYEWRRFNGIAGRQAVKGE